MTERLTIIPQPIVPSQAPGRRPQKPVSGGGFDQLLQSKIEQGQVRFSRHATERMNSRGIQFSANQMERLESAVSQVNAKGGKESLVMLDDTALVVSVKNETVVTVVDRSQLKNNVFTNIDSAIIA
jgi:flagellar operon protein